MSPAADSSSQLAHEDQDSTGPPTPPKDNSLLLRASRSSLGVHDSATLDVPREQSGSVSSPEIQRPPSATQMSSNPTPGQTQTSITQQSTSEDGSKDKDHASWASKEKDPGLWAASTVTVPVRRRSRRKSLKAMTTGKGSTMSNGKKSSSPTQSSSNGKQTTKRRKISFLERITHICTCCVGHSSRAHEIDVEEGASHQSEQKDTVITEEQPASTNDLAEPALPSSHAHGQSSSTTTVPAPPPPSAPLTVVPPTPSTPPSARATPDPDSDIAIVVPPTPSRQLLPLDETDGLTSGAVQPPGSTGDELKSEVRVTVGESDDSDGSFDDEPFADGRQVESWEDEEQRLIRQGGAGVPVGADGKLRPLLPPLEPKYAGRKCLVLDLDETLVHSSLRPVPAPDYIVPVEIENNWHNFYVLKRPGVDNFLRKMGELYEVVVFTASLAKYADPVLDRLDPSQTVVAHRLFRESCYNHRGNYVKDLSQLGRPVSDTIILDNSPASYIFHPHNAVPVSSWFNDPHDTELTDLCPFLADLGGAQDVRGVLNPFVNAA